MSLISKIKLSTSTPPHPDGVFSLFCLQMFSMVGFSMLFSLLTLYCVHVLHFSDQRAYAVSDAFNAGVFATSVLGGYLAGKFLGYRFAFILSGVLSVLGLALLLSTNITAFYYGLGMYVLAQGIIVPTMYVLLGMLYPENDSRRDSGFILSYIGMNVGSFFASLFSGPIANSYGYWAAFLVGLFFAIITLINYFMVQYKFKPEAIERVTRAHAEKISPLKKWIGLVITLAFIPVVTQLMKHSEWNNTILISLGVIGALLVLYVAYQHQGAVRKKLMVFLILVTISMMFWAMYLLTPTVFPIFTELNLDRHFFNWSIPTASFSSLNPFFIITLGPVLSQLWLKLNKRNITVSTAAQFVIALVLMGTGYLVLTLGIHFQNSLGLVMMFWMVLSYFFQTVGELFIGPIGYSMVGSLVPKDQEGTMMGIWQLASGVPGVLTYYFANLITQRTGNETHPLQTNPAYAHVFTLSGSMTIAVGILLFLLLPWIRKMMLP